MAPTPEEAAPGLGRELGLPLLTLLGTLGLSASRVAQGVPLDGVSLALHLVGGLAALRLVAPLVRLTNARSGALGEPALSPVPAPSAESDVHGPVRSSPAELFDLYLAAPAAFPAAYALPAGRAWLMSGPYAGVVFALVLGVHALAVPLLRTPLTLLLLPVACAPLALWWWRGRATRRARGGVALLLTPTQLIVRDAVGARSAPWSEVQAVRTESQPAWDMLRGARRAPLLVISRRGTPSLRLREDELGVAVPRALLRVEAYRSAVGATPASASAPAADSSAS
ncbi:MAG: hypothetical protein IPL19_17865 [Sandaracinaceae bacterium]|nr:hypothetical protein [Sandaracinaceae bacterium]